MSKTKTDYTHPLRQSLYKHCLDNATTFYEEPFLFVGIIENVRARKYKYEVYWHNSAEDSIPNISWGAQPDEFFDECTNSRMCEDLKEAHAYGFSAVQESLHLNSKTKIRILNLTK